MEEVVDMKEVKMVPKLRFIGYDKTWREQKFCDLYTFKSTNSFSRDCLNYQNGAVLNIHYGDIHKKFSAPFSSSQEQLPFINPDIDLSKIDKSNYVQNGDVIFADASEDYNDIGKAIEIIETNNENILSGLHTLHARPKEKLASGLIHYLLQHYKNRLSIKKVAQGTKVLGISSRLLGQIEIKFPSELKEQQKIASFLSSVDKKIQQLTRKKELLEQYKKGVMQKIFKQEIRFKRDDGGEFPEWEEKRLGDIATFSKGKTISKGDLVFDGNVKCILYGELYTRYAEVIEEVVSSTHLNPKDLILSEVNDLLIPSSGETHIDIARVSCIIKDGIALGGDINVLKTSENGVFLAYYLSSAKKNEIAKLAQGNSVVHLYNKQLKSLSILIPTKEEQEKIADFLIIIDEKIDAVKIQIEKSRQFKKGLLQQMFV